MKKRAQIRVTGIVQGVGFRPFIYTLASRLRLNGWVRNSTGSVDIEVEGENKPIDTFIKALTEEAPPIAQIDSINIRYVEPNGFKAFEIIDSQVVQEAFQPVSPDICICDDCLNELFDPRDRRYHYPFINCTNCGPRFTIICDIPYDRPLTTMSQFQLCPECNKEYKEPSNRRFHAQPVACPNCGPGIWLEVGEHLDENIGISEPIAYYNKEMALLKAQSLLATGKILAVKGLGGFHLACDATNAEAVRELRNRKLRVDKPFALMMADMETVQSYCMVDPAEARLLESKERPIVILQRKPDTNIALEVAPNQTCLGVMLPYTPLHYLLFSELNPVGDKVESGTASIHIPKSLVMTSGNLREEPIAFDNDEARIRLASMADAFLMHNREIRTRCDDSVVRVFQMTGSKASNKDEIIFPIRRSRGYIPFPVYLNDNAPPILAVGGELKNTFCLTRKNYAFMSHHVGDMENYETLRSFVDGIEHIEKLFRIKPLLISHDLHPNYLSTRYALERSQNEGIPALGVQHHHAHIAACMAEHNLSPGNDVFGVAFDGTGFGEDGAIWGGEFFLAGYESYQRIAHLEYMPLPGGDTSIRNPARIALAYMWQLGKDWSEAPIVLDALSDQERTVLRSQLEQKINTPVTSSMGRLFDAVSAIIGVRQKINYEAQAAIEMENLVDRSETGSYPIGVDLSNTLTPQPIQLKILFESIMRDLWMKVPAPIVAARFHNTIAQLVLEGLMAMRNKYGDKPVVLSGGVWQNITLLAKTIDLLQNNQFSTYIHRQVPTNDGGIALGQAVVALHNTKI